MQVLTLLQRIKWWQVGTYLIVLVGIVWLVLLFLTIPEKVLKGHITLPGLSAETQVMSDTNGFYQIVAQNQLDLHLTLGYLQAAQQLDFLDLLLRAATGNLTEIYGKQVQEVDALVRTIGFEAQGYQILATLNSADHALLKAYADGVNQLIHQHARERSVRLRLHRIEPLEWNAARVIAVLLLYEWCLANDWQLPLFITKLAVIYPPEKIDAGFPFLKGFSCNLVPSPQLLTDLNRLYASSSQLEQICGLAASNKIYQTKVVKDGPAESILVLSQVLPWQNYLIGWKTPEGRAVGFALPGTPFLITGRSDTAVWQVNYRVVPQIQFYLNANDQTLDFEWDGKYHNEVSLLLALPHMTNSSDLENYCQTKPLIPLEILWGQGHSFVKFKSTSARISERSPLLDFSWPIDDSSLDSLNFTVRPSILDSDENARLASIPRHSQRTLSIAPAIWQVCRPFLDPEDSPLARFCWRTLNEWSEWPAAVTSGSLIFQTFTRHLLESIYADELNLVDELALPQLLQQNDWVYVNLYYLLQDGTSSWFDNIQTGDKVEFASEIIKQAWQRCLLELQTNLGFDTLNYGLAAVESLAEPKSQLNRWTKILPGLTRTESIFGGNRAAQSLWLPLVGDWLELRRYVPEHNLRFWKEWKGRIELPMAEASGFRVVATFIPQTKR